MDMSTARFYRQPDNAADAATDPTSREAIAAVFSVRAGGVDAKTADDRTKSFYRASGYDWALALA